MIARSSIMIVKFDEQLLIPSKPVLWQRSLLESSVNERERYSPLDEMKNSPHFILLTSYFFYP